MYGDCGGEGLKVECGRSVMTRCWFHGVAQGQVLAFLRCYTG